MAAIESRAVQAVLAWHPDRLTRQTTELNAFIKLIERTGATVQTVTAGAYDLTTPTGRMQARIVGTVAEYESEHKSERIRRKVDELVGKGEPPGGGHRPFGYVRVTDSHGNPTKPPAYTIVSDEAELIREAAERLLAGASLRSIVADWQTRGILSPAGNPWRQGALGRMLTGGFITGLRLRQTDPDPARRAARSGQVTHTEGDPALWPHILDRATWQALHAVLTAPERRKHVSNARTNLLVGFLHCGRCGRALVGRTRMGGRFPSDAKRRYVCPPRTLGGCSGVAILTAETDAEITRRVLEALDSPTMREALTDAATDAPTDPLGERAEAEARMAELAGDYAAGQLTRGEWQAARSVLVARLDAAPAVARRALRLPANVGEVWPALDLETRRAIIAEVIERVTVTPAVRGRARFDPDRLLGITWTDAVSMRPDR
jgi:site-specific DNA recombinase